MPEIMSWQLFGIPERAFGATMTAGKRTRRSFRIFIPTFFLAVLTVCMAFDTYDVMHLEIERKRAHQSSDAKATTAAKKLGMDPTAANCSFASVSTNIATVLAGDQILDHTTCLLADGHGAAGGFSSQACPGVPVRWYSVEAATSLLKGQRILVMGDSVMRRAVRQLSQYL